MDKGTVLGLLLDGAQRVHSQDEVREQWKVRGDEVLAQRAAQRQEANRKKRGQKHVPAVAGPDHGDPQE
jgi:hypothetical protein